MRNRLGVRCNTCVLRVALLLIAPVFAQAAPAPSQDFWEYMTDFSDDNGELLDPLEYDQLAALQSNDAVVADPQADAQIKKNDALKIKNTDMKTNNRSSVRASSSAMNGAKL